MHFVSVFIEENIIASINLRSFPDKEYDKLDDAVSRSSSSPFTGMIQECIGST